MAPLPHVIILNICYWWTLIYLYRPFYPQGQTAGQSTRDSRLFADLSIKMCDRAAHKIVQLIRIFRQSHSLQYFPRNMLQVITACGTTLLLQEATVSESALKKRSVAQEGVDVCTSALREIALTWPYARELAEQLEGRVSGQIRDPPVASSSAPVPSSLEAFAEPELDDQEVSRMFYRFVHEWGQDEPESPYSSGQHSQGSSPMLSSSYPLMGEISMDTFGQSGWGQALHPSSSLYQHNVSAPHPPDGSFHGEGGGDARY
ncbi:hypothetical protein FRC09_020776 [Ceratobasidium sp. 395]|nr:hypothetical protein FRC09_020776 [Ceratobasidium sp. 395]